MKKKVAISIIKDTVITALCLAAAFTVCLPIYRGGHDISSAAICIFILAILIISSLTSYRIYGIIASVIGIFTVNYAYTFPFFKLNFSLTGYPLTFLTMLGVSVMAGMVTTNIKRNAKICAQIETEKTKVELLRSISHDIRTPLTSITGSASAYLDNIGKLSDEEKTLLVSDIREEAEWLTRIIENVLSITKISDSAAFLNKNPEMVEEFIGETVQKFKRNYPSINVRVTVPKELIFVTVDVTLIEQVIINILQNAAIHGKTTTEIRISVTKRGDMAHFSFSDNGIGISRNIMPNIFNRSFVHTDHGASDITRDMGIGLSVCNSIIAAHGGKMSAHNQKNGGALFEFTLPIEKNV